MSKFLSHKMLKEYGFIRIQEKPGFYGQATVLKVLVRLFVVLSLLALSCVILFKISWDWFLVPLCLFSVVAPYFGLFKVLRKKRVSQLICNIRRNTTKNKYVLLVSKNGYIEKMAASLFIMQYVPKHVSDRLFDFDHVYVVIFVPLVHKFFFDELINKIKQKAEEAEEAQRMTEFRCLNELLWNYGVYRDGKQPQEPEPFFEFFGSTK